MCFWTTLGIFHIFRWVEQKNQGGQARCHLPEEEKIARLSLAAIAIYSNVIYSMHFIICITFNVFNSCILSFPPDSLYSMDCILFIAFHVLYAMHCMLCLVCYALDDMHCMLCIVFYAFFSHCIICILFYTLHSMHCILCSIFYAFKSMHLN